MRAGDRRNRRSETLCVDNDPFQGYLPVHSEDPSSQGRCGCERCFRRQAGDLDLSAVKEFELAMRPALKHGGPVTIDASQLMFVDSRGIRLLMHAARRLEPSGCLILHGLTHSVRKVIDVSGSADLVPNIHVLDHKIGKQGAA